MPYCGLSVKNKGIKNFFFNKLFLIFAVLLNNLFIEK